MRGRSVLSINEAGSNISCRCVRGSHTRLILSHGGKQITQSTDNFRQRSRERFSILFVFIGVCEYNFRNEESVDLSTQGDDVRRSLFKGPFKYDVCSRGEGGHENTVYCGQTVPNKCISDMWMAPPPCVKSSLSSFLVSNPYLGLSSICIRSERGNQRLKWGYLIVLPYFIAATVVGALHWDDCPIQPQIPMLVTGKAEQTFP